MENLATLLWRKRRLLQAETAEIEKAQFLSFDLALQSKIDELEYAQLKVDPDGKLGHSNPLNVLRNAITILVIHRLFFAAGYSQAGDEVRRILKTIYGYENEGPQPYSCRGRRPRARVEGRELRLQRG